MKIKSIIFVSLSLHHVKFLLSCLPATPIILPVLLIYFLAFPLPLDAQSQTIIEVGKFSAASPGDSFSPEWKPLTFKKIERHTTYTLVKDNDTVVIKAVAEASASGLTREIKINPKEYPIIQWRWKVVIS